MVEPNAMPDKRNPAVESLMRVLNGVALALIALSVLGQCLFYGLIYIGTGSEDLPSVGSLGAIAFATVPGIVLAFAKLILNVLRSPKNPEARPKAAVYFAIVALWVLLRIIAEKHLIDRAETIGVPEQQTEPSEQFLSGQEWAKANTPIHNTQCKGNHEFNRGCWHQIDLRRQAQREAGYEWAKKNLPRKATLCQGAPYFVLGCRTYFMQHLHKPKPDGMGKYAGMTTAECIEEVNANYEAAKALDLEHENSHSIGATLRRQWVPALQDCENYDKLVDDQFMPQAYQRLESAIGKLKARQTLAKDEAATVLQDFAKMSKIPEQPYTEAYMRRFDEYSKRLSGEHREPEIAYPQISCAEYQAKLDEISRLDEERSAAMNALKRPGGVVSDSAKYSRLNQQRIEMLWDWKLYTEGAKKAGCEFAKR